MPLCVVVRRAQDRLVIPFIPRGSVMPQPVVHFELPADDVERARTFYRDAFGWNVITVPDMDYTLLGTATTTDDMGRPTAAGEINGGMFARTEDLTQPLITIAVEDIDAALTKVEQCGGKTLRGRQAVGDMGFTGYFSDSEGTVVGLWQNAG
jgi:uncharacterized protein